MQGVLDKNLRVGDFLHGGGRIFQYGNTVLISISLHSNMTSKKFEGLTNILDPVSFRLRG